METHIAMSVSAWMREYGAMRAVGMTVHQLNRMVWGETMTYTVFGVMLTSVIVAVTEPARQMKKMTVVDTIGRE